MKQSSQSFFQYLLIFIIAFVFFLSFVTMDLFTKFSATLLNKIPIPSLFRCEIGTTVPIDSIQGDVYRCHSLFIGKLANNDIRLGESLIVIIAKNQIIEGIQTNNHPNSILIQKIYELSNLSKIRFKAPIGQNPGLLIIEFKNSDPLKYLMSDPSSCVKSIKQATTSLGITSNITKTSNTNTIISAQRSLEKAKDIEHIFDTNPSIELIEQMMDLWREAIENFSTANKEPQLKEAKTLIQTFLSRKDVMALLDSQNKKASVKLNPNSSTNDIIDFSVMSVIPPEPPLIPNQTNNIDQPNQEDQNTSFNPEELQSSFIEQMNNAMTYLSDDEHDDDLLLTTPKHLVKDRDMDELVEMFNNIDNEFQDLVNSFSSP